MAPRTLNRLTDVAVRKAKARGWYADGGGLYLRIDASARRWVFVFHLGGKRSEMGLGSPADITLAEVRDLRDVYRRQVKTGQNPIHARRQARAVAVAHQAQTFAAWAKEIAPVIAPKAPKARKAWVRSMTDWTGNLKDKPLASITTQDVLAALKPYWQSRPETGARMRMRIEAVLDAAKAKGHIPDPWTNPARWKGHLQHLLERRAAPVRHHRAMPYAELPAFMALLRAKEPVSAKALEFTILTAARTSETIYATWAEMDLDAKVWSLPAGRMKMHRPHRVPLSEAALAVLEAVKPPLGQKASEWVFPSLWIRGRPLSTAAMERMLQDLGFKGKATVHGFRSAFSTWAADSTEFDRSLVEAALAHLVGDEVERAYRRTDALAKRRRLMEAWAAFLAHDPRPTRA